MNPASASKVPETKVTDAPQNASDERRSSASVHRGPLIPPAAELGRRPSLMLGDSVFETLGPWCIETKTFNDTVCKILIEESGDIRAKHFLYNRISLAIQQGNAASILGTRPSDNRLDEIYNL